ncbi:MAG: PD-(D/E)XK nuclease family protein [Chloroflexi bacterium]|nr:PD-(D/E)XK nuclease family protein [Chloroflexota bacterium]
MYNDAREQTAANTSVSLVASHRTAPAILSWVNAVFGRLFPGDDLAIAPAYSEMTAVRSDSPAGHPVSRIGDARPLRAAEVRRTEAAHVAGVCQAVVTEGWLVGDRGGAPHRPARFRDIAILIPTRTGLPDLDHAFEQAGIPVRVDGGSLVFQTQELRDLINILAATDDPADSIAVVAALRSPAFACSDADLARHKLAHGSFNYLAPENPPGPVTAALLRLRAFHDLRPTTSLAGLVQAILGETGIVASAILDTADRDAFRRARFTVEQARAFEADGPQPLRALVDWLEERSSRPIVDHEGAGLDEDEDAVRIMTVHGAKGLEFPVVIMAGFGTQPQAVLPPTWAIERASGELAVCIGPKSRGQFSYGPVAGVLAQELRHAEAEQVRLLYVAATRARDHLIVSFYKGQRGNASGVDRLLAVQAADGLPVLAAPDNAAHQTPGRLSGIVVEPSPFRDVATAAAARRELVAASYRLRVTSATALAGRKEARADDSEPWSHGRGSTRLGRAVHAVIQSVPLSASPGVVAAFARAQAVAEAIPDREADIVRLVRRALESQAMARARAAASNGGRALREVPFAVEIDGTIVEGFLDMLIDGPGGLEIVDWKTDGITAGEVDARLDHYRLQAGLYVLGIERATAHRPTRVTYAFLSPAIERDLGDTAALAAFAANELAAGRGRQPAPPG